MNHASYDYENPQSNIVSGDILKKVQRAVLRNMAQSVMKSMGPAGSNTLILKGNNSSVLTVEYTKDGKKIIQNIKYNNPIEMSIQSEIEDITRHIEKVVGDGTSSAVIMSSIIFDKLIDNDVYENGNPYQTMRDFKYVVELIKDNILENKRECTLDDIYNISLISTNGNEALAEQMLKVYEEYGMDVFIDVGISINANTYTKEYDGLTLDCGYSDAAYINTQEGVSRLINPRIYAFEDPIDTPHMVAFFDTIIKSATDGKPTPTVILAPRISKDQAALMRKLVSHLHSYSSDDYTQKPPILIITNIDGLSLNHFHHIAQLCGCPLISKYIDDNNEKRDQEQGLAPTLENVVDFCGTAELVEADANNTKFKNPDKMWVKNEDGSIFKDENDHPKPSLDYESIINFLEAELDRAINGINNAGQAGSLKRQLNMMKANMVEILIGGVSMADRDSFRDLVEDAVLNCRSAAKNGVGWGANYEGYLATYKLDAIGFPKNIADIIELIIDAYMEIIEMLYSTAYSGDELDEILTTMYSYNLVDENAGPCNIATGEFDGNVLTSIMTDITILDTISKIITIMLTSNQALIQAPNLNNYR